MGTVSDYRTGRYTPSESSLLVEPRSSPGVERLILAASGYTVSPPSWAPGNPLNAGHTAALARAGYRVIVPDGAGVFSFNNPASQAAYEGALAGVQGASQVALMGVSMGGLEVLQLVKAHPAAFRGVLLFCPATDLDWAYGNGSGPFAAPILAAYGGDYATSAGRRVGDEIATWRDKCPIKIFHGDADATVPLSQSQAFVAGVGQAQVTLEVVPGADHGLIDDVDPSETVAFFNALNW